MPQRRWPATPPSILAALFLVAAVPNAAGGQVIQGRLLEAASETGISGAMASLADRSGQRIDQALTGTGGLFRLRAPAAGEYRIRADRIGYAPTFSEYFDLASADTITIELVARIEPVSLIGIEAEGKRRCRVRPEEGLAVARAWEEARKALAAAAWTEDRGLYRYEMLVIRRRLDGRGRRVEREDRIRAQALAPAPFASRPADSLLAHGFARFTEAGSEFWGPDAEVLLSDLFLDTHCFRLAGRQDESGEPVGLEFEPVPGREVAEISGTMWLDPVSARLARLDFRYVNLDVHPRLMEAAPGGGAEFRTLPNGTWIVPSWHLRMFRPGEAPHPLTGRPTASIAAVIMEHGEVLRVHGERGVVFEGDTGRRIAGTVFDTLRAGLPGARVFVNGEGTEVVTDADGRFELTHLAPYEYTVYFTHPYLERLWYQPEPVEVEVELAGPNPVRVDFEAPSLEDVLDEVCGHVSRPRPPLHAENLNLRYNGVLSVAVTDAEGNPAADATVLTMAGTRRVADPAGDRTRVRGRTSDSGLYRICWVPLDVPLEVVALSGDERLDRDAFEEAATLADLFPGRVQEITLAPAAPFRTLVFRVDGPRRRGPPGAMGNSNDVS